MALSFYGPKWRQNGGRSLIRISHALVFGADSTFLYDVALLDVALLDVALLDVALLDGALHAAPFPGYVSVRCQSE